MENIMGFRFQCTIGRLYLLFFLLVGLSVGTAFSTTGPSPKKPLLAQSLFPASGNHKTVLTVPSLGRYSIVATSKEGVSLQLVDRMAGPRKIQGIPGETDGRIDQLLDRRSEARR